jgi:hypothetical protein
MKEAILFDDVARIMARPIPRRQALRQILQAVAGAALASTFWPRNAQADPVPSPPGCMTDNCCPGNHKNCNGVVCCNKNTQTCCGTGASSACCRPPQVCVDGRCQSKSSPSDPD